MGRFGLYAALALCICGVPATAAAERFERWSLEQPGDFIVALFKRSISFDNRTATSELAFVLIKRRNTLRSCLYRSMARSTADAR